AGALSASQFISFIIALLMLSQPARGLATLNAVAQEGFGAFERILDVIDARPSITDRAGAAALNARAGAISFQNVQFTYDGDAPALNDFSLDLKPGMTTALIGESGAGKSTVFNLLLRFYEPLSGSIFIDGAEIRTVTLESLRRAIAIVSQEAVLFDDTVAANIGFGRAHATRDEIINAAIAASADEFIRALPNGYDTRVGEAGLNLSGGQRQRIAIARAFLKDAPILLLDEATSALDAASEVAVQAAFARLSKGRTTLVIAHRLATIRSADLIVSMSNGKVIETGDHDELMRRDGYYARVAQLQFS
ncbi:MAG: ATP-binding cassette domain-containing protein, partial [Parvularculaceae bacterium]|nr:ATP-binding cassette domain-containing protein [Parvularculaceae bacterium]